MSEKYFRSRFRREIASGDNRDKFSERLTRMSSDVGLQAKVVELISAAQATAKAHTKEVAIGKGTQVYNLGMQLRHVHNTLGHHVHDSCHGALYRTTRAERLMMSGDAGKDRLHCEHTVPIKLAAELIYNRRAETPLAFSTYLLTRTPVVAMTREERESLSPRRACGTSKKRAWADSHPSFLDGEPADPSQVLLFARYLETDLELIRWTDGKSVDLSKYTMADHMEAIRLLPLYDASNYGFPD
mgnify:CR=1 FL=1